MPGFRFKRTFVRFDALCAPDAQEGTGLCETTTQCEPISDMELLKDPLMKAALAAACPLGTVCPEPDTQCLCDQTTTDHGELKGLDALALKTTIDRLDALRIELERIGSKRGLLPETEVSPDKAAEIEARLLEALDEIRNKKK
jgi:hypothetical protein